MKLLDRYVLAAFLRNYLVSMVVLVGFYVVMDMVFNFDEFAKHTGRFSAWQVAWGILTYYFYQSFFVYGRLAGVIPVLATAFTLMRMSRFNELTALLAAGVPLLRVAAPIILAAIGINLVIQPVNQEVVIPAVMHQIARTREAAVENPDRSFAVRAMPDGAGGIFDATRYHPPQPGQPAWVESLTIVERDSSGNLRMIAAPRADWDHAAAAWILTDGTAVHDIGTTLDEDVLADIDPETLAGSPAVPLDRVESPITPSEIQLFRSAHAGVVAGGTYFDLLSTQQINELLARPQQYASTGLLRAKHTRLASHVMNVVLILLCIPAVLTRQPGQLRQAAARTFLLIGAAMATVFICQTLAKDPPLALADRWPAWMAWAPILIFGPLAVILLDRIES